MMKSKFQIQMISGGGEGCGHEEACGQGVGASAASAMPYFLIWVIGAWLLTTLLFLLFLMCLKYCIIIFFFFKKLSE